MLELAIIIFSILMTFLSSDEEHSDEIFSKIEEK